MRTKKAGLNAIINLINYIIMILPNFFIRKVFLTTLGEELLGLNSLYQNIIGFLCISELGLSLAISYALYSPIARNDKPKIKGYISYYTKFYRKVSIFIFSVGMIIVPFIHIFTNSRIKNMKIYFIMFLINTCMTYLFSAKFCLLNVSQENYIISITQTLTNLLMAISQIILLYEYKNYFIFICIQIIFNLLQMLILNIIINRKFNWLKNEKGILEKKHIKELYKTMKGLFFHKISAMVLFATDNIVISSFLNLFTVANFGNYYLVISGAQSIMIKLFDGITASVGNLLTENNSEKSYDIYKKSQFVAFCLVSIMSICILNSINIFIDLWIGEKYRIDNLSIFLLVMNFYFLGMRLPIEKFKETSGIYHEDRYWAVCQAILNLIISILMVNIIGLPGVFLGTFISNYSVEFWIKPKLVYSRIFKVDYKIYLKQYFIYLLIFLITYFITNRVINLIAFRGILKFISVNLVSIVIVLFLYYMIFRSTKEYIYIKNILLRKSN
ncbi:lipopolysaccharide biosynthesis protein [Clostridium baratii]|uniref:lipopolysaccharide biosynthesis protein n=1 Tax=Clostridium baratii TaxID=1561 RepID=UPI003D3494C2